METHQIQVSGPGLLSDFVGHLLNAMRRVCPSENVFGIQFETALLRRKGTAEAIDVLSLFLPSRHLRLNQAKSNLYTELMQICYLLSPPAVH